MRAHDASIYSTHRESVLKTTESEKKIAFSIWKKKKSEIAALLPRNSPSALKSFQKLKQYLKPDVLVLIDLIWMYFFII